MTSQKLKKLCINYFKSITSYNNHKNESEVVSGLNLVPLDEMQPLIQSWVGEKTWKVAVDSTKDEDTREICTLPAEWKEVWIYAEKRISGRNDDSFLPVNIFINKNHKYNYPNTRNQAAYTSGIIGILTKDRSSSVEFKINEKNVLYNDGLTILKVVWR